MMTILFCSALSGWWWGRGGGWCVLTSTKNVVVQALLLPVECG